MGQAGFLNLAQHFLLRSRGKFNHLNWLNIQLVDAAKGSKECKICYLAINKSRGREPDKRWVYRSFEDHVGGIGTPLRYPR